MKGKIFTKLTQDNFESVLSINIDLHDRALYSRLIFERPPTKTSTTEQNLIYELDDVETSVFSSLIITNCKFASISEGFILET